MLLSMSLYLSICRVSFVQRSGCEIIPKEGVPCGWGLGFLVYIGLVQPRFCKADISGTTLAVTQNRDKPLRYWQQDRA